jgi:Ca2+-binding RTX toxin-like protein
MIRLVEPMERRILMATDVDPALADHVTFENGVLVISGTSGDDQIHVGIPAGQYVQGMGPPLQVTFNGITKSFVRPGTPGDRFVSPTPEVTRLIIDGGAGNDRILVGRVGAGLGAGVGALVGGGAGDDTILGGDGSDTLRGGPGNDRLVGRKGNDQLAGGKGADEVLQAGYTLERRVTLLDGGTLLVRGTPTADIITVAHFTRMPPFGEEGRWVEVMWNGESQSFDPAVIQRIEVRAGGGHDSVSVFHSVPATLRGGGGEDRLEGGSGDDAMIGGAGNDYIVAELGNDTLIGGPGIDQMFGGEGDDVFFGGPDNDVMYGEAGDDARVRNPLSREPGKRVPID